MSAKDKGSEREYAVKRKLEDEGWTVVRSPASGSPADLWAMRRSQIAKRITATEMHLIQVKGNTGSPFKSFVPAERNELLGLAERIGATAWLVHWPPHGECRWMGPDRWPKTKERA